MVPNLLTIAGFDPSGGAGVAADLKTFAALGTHGTAVVTALTAQNTQGVAAIHVPPAGFTAAQIDAIFSDINIAAVKIGMLACGAIVEEVAKRLAFYKPPFIVLDPVLTATSGDRLATTGTAKAIERHLLPLVTLITPNILEAAQLTGREAPTDLEGRRRAALELRKLGAKAVLIKGGHAGGATSDDLLLNGAGFALFTAARIAARNTHGTGCTLASAIAVYLAQGLALDEAVRAAKAYVSDAIAAADALSVGQGPGPLHHFHTMWKR
ncbi:MAG TPA: bifunctional hydroxymethylpyrimidine kinase/phosphomethylpyrimidine kinase [Methylocella sp.]|nr:bifunctional hydroxymethylpyrimidine kinase/phosphomethylpyrimidine kinase [Methylocella sp.]